MIYRKEMQSQDKIDAILNHLLQSYLEKRGMTHIKKYYRIKGYVTSSSRGRSKRSMKEFSVPLWALKDGEDYFTYYVAHELSHQISILQYKNYFGGHNHLFYRVFSELCPKHLQHFEIKYKKSCKKYGIC